jgi:exopolysaccharide biosynthesis polyprenyl glycosylphosphotransferase
MFSRVYFYNLLFRVLAYLLPLFGFGMSSYIHFGNAWFPYVTSVVSHYYLIFPLFVELVWIPAASYSKLSSVAGIFRGYAGIRAAMLAGVASFCLQGAVFLFVKQLIISRIFIILSNAILCLCSLAAGNLFQPVEASPTWPGKLKQIWVERNWASRTWRGGTVKLARRSVAPILSGQSHDYRPQGLEPAIQSSSVIGAPESYHLEKLKLNQIVVVMSGAGHSPSFVLPNSLPSFGSPDTTAFDFAPRFSLRERPISVDPAGAINLAISPVESFAYSVLKRILDLLFATLGVMILSPAFMITALLVKLSSRGPILFSQERVGRHGKHFQMLKFRTMYCSTIAESDTTWTTRCDSRCTPIGAKLRKFSLDELPQLFNVIRGEMSLVGPRPERPYFVAKFRNEIHKYDLRHYCQVGMTGWAQVNGLRGNTSIPERLHYDLHYLCNWSLVWDLQIILRTIAILKNQTGY